MSRLAFQSNSETSPVTVEAPTRTAAHHILLEATCKPIGAGNYNKIMHNIKLSNSKNLENKEKTFEMNETRRVQSAGTLLYQTTETYGTSMSIEKIIETLNSADLTLRVNFHRPGIHSNTTCMELSADILQKLVAASPDAHDNKVAELRVKAEQTATIPRHGALLSLSRTKQTCTTYRISITKLWLLRFMYHEDN